MLATIQDILYVIYTYPMTYEFCGRFRGTRTGYNIEIILRSILSSSNNTHYTTLLPFQKKHQVYQEVDEPERDNGRFVLERVVDLGQQQVLEQSLGQTQPQTDEVSQYLIPRRTMRHQPLLK